MDLRGERRRRGARRAAVLALVAAGVLGLTGCSTINSLLGQGAPAAQGAGGSDAAGAGGTGAEGTGAAGAGAAGAGLDPAEEFAGGKISIQPPTGWVDDQKYYEEFDEAVFVEPTESTTSGELLDAVVVVTVEPANGDDLDAVVADLRDRDEEVTLDEPLTLSDGTAAHVLDSTFTDTDDETTRSLEVIVVQDDELIIASIDALEEVWDEYGVVGEASVRSLTLSG